VLLALRQYPQAVETLERFSAHLDRPGDILHATSFLSLYIVALRQAGMSTKSQAILARLLELTAPDGGIRVYLDAGTPMQEALQNFLVGSRKERPAAPADMRSYVSTLLRAFDQEAQQCQSRAEASASSPQRASSVSRPAHDTVVSSITPVLGGPLTAQEQRVLRLLSAGLSNHDIAETLVISNNTVKTHLKHLFRKLNVRNRSQASALARDIHVRASHPIELTPTHHPEG
jgi:LuxR family maltose regulon positive regulatory protein